MSAGDILKGISEIAKFIDESEDRTWRLMKKGLIPAYQHTKKAPWRMSKSSYRDWLARKGAA